MGDTEAKIESVAECRSCGPDVALDLSRVMPGTAGTYDTFSSAAIGTAYPVSEDTGYVHITDREFSSSRISAPIRFTWIRLPLR